MKWLPSSLLLLLLGAVHASFSANNTHNGWSTQRKLALREQTRQLWYHGFDNYMEHAFPLDELAPLTCSGRGPNWENPDDIATNDVAGNFSLTLIDVLDTLVVLDDRPGFELAVKNVIKWVSFDVNVRPQVFETTIRVLGGLLSGHIFASKPGQPFFLPWYRGELLQLAHDLGNRLLPAFSTPTGLPYARINLRHGVLRGEGVDTCTAGAGSLLLEFATLSRLTGDARFEKAAHKAFWAIWNRRTDIGLVGNTINIRGGSWTRPEVSGIGAGIDSFHEYALKWYIMSRCAIALFLSQPCLGDLEFLDVWDDTYAAIMRWSRSPNGFWFRQVNMYTGDAAYNTLDSLSAFWSGLQVLAGDVYNAVKLHMLYYNIWRKHSGLPEVYDMGAKVATSTQYPLRPEFIESTWYLYRATGDPFYLDVAEQILFDLTVRSKVPCGLSGIKDLVKNTLDDRMESFALSETLKYLYLLFDEDNFLHKSDNNYVFTTEGHLLALDQQPPKKKPSPRRKMRNIENHQCPAYTPLTEDSGLTVGIRSSGQMDYAQFLVNQEANDQDQAAWSPNGWCDRPLVHNFAYEFILSPNGKIISEDLSPSRLKLDVVEDGYIVNNVTGIRIHIVQRLDRQGYDVRRLGHYDVRAGQTVYVNDPLIFGPTQVAKMQRAVDIPLRFTMLPEDDTEPHVAELLNQVEIATTGYSALFGPELALSPSEDSPPLRINNQDGLPVFYDEMNGYGCDPYDQVYENAVLLTIRGECTFLEKLVHAKDAGAAGVLVVSDEDLPLNPTADEEDLEAAGDLGDAGLIMLTPEAGRLVGELLKTGQVMLQLGLSVPEELPVPKEVEQAPKLLILNGHSLLNTRLLV
ncbi:glycoside hydrolase family 47 protein [Roridomyces roridus]|uniref:alpha-1,2-Mannosidase n=1 Tax=Roridomyces roridus TaxID=1738132 RepID=A0AAD7C4S1_9AGAR|nr:glycoside hydrolase family 47 protein [Roridomyces roridus]